MSAYMDLFSVIDHTRAIFLPLQEEVCVSWHDGYVNIIDAEWRPSGPTVSLAERYTLFREDRVTSTICLCCWVDMDEGEKNTLLCFMCRWSASWDEKEHSARVLLMSQLPANEDVVGLIAATYCAMAACEIDEAPRRWLFEGN
jgi:hypothetical protein